MSRAATVKLDVIATITTFGDLLRYLRQRAQMTQPSTSSPPTINPPIYLWIDDTPPACPVSYGHEYNAD